MATDDRAMTDGSALEGVRIKNTFIDVPDDEEQEDDSRRVRGNRNKTEPATGGLRRVSFDELEPGEPAQGSEAAAGDASVEGPEIPQTPEGPTPYWAPPGGAAGSAGALPEVQSEDFPVRFQVKNTFIDVEEESPGVRQARHARHKTVPASSGGGALDEDETPAGRSQTELSEETDSFSVHGLRADTDVGRADTLTSSRGDQTVSDGAGSVDLSMVKVTSVTVPRMQVNAMTQSQVDGYCRTEWVVDARKLKGTDKQIVSPQFEVQIRPGAPAIVFKMTLHPKTTDSKGGVSFKKSEGVGHVQLKCHTDEGDLEAVGDASLRFAVGSPPKETKGPFEHTFYDNVIFNLPRKHADWDFNEASDDLSLSLVVTVDIGPSE
jgi:hypothetical protein